MNLKEYNKLPYSVGIEYSDGEWTLSDKSGEVPLHRQSKETQDQIYEVLK